MTVPHLRLLLIAAAFIPLFAAAAGAQDPTHRTLELEQEVMKLENGGVAIADRGMIVVPLKRFSPGSRMIEVEVYRFPAEDSVAGARPPIFRLFGGPGFTGLGPSLKRRGYYEAAIRPFTRLADLVVVGQRGIGSSVPNTTCPLLPRIPAGRRVSDAEAAAHIRDGSKQCRARWERDGYDLTGFNVVEAAADVDDVRRALGYDQITIWGGSFGSHWGMAIMRYHPGIVARAVLTGMEGPDHTYDMPSGVLNALSRMAAEAEQSPQLQGLVPAGGLIAAFDSVVTRLEREPLTVPVKLETATDSTVVWLDADRIRELAYGYSARASSRAGMRTWPADVMLLYRGEYSEAATAIARRSHGFRQLPTASFFMLDCGSGISRERHASLEGDPAVRLVGDLGWYYDTACPMWGADLGEEFRQNFTSALPTVIVHGTWDTSTPYENAVELAPFFTNSHFVTVDGGSHGALGEAIDANGAFRTALEQFVMTGDMSRLPEEVQLPPIDWAVPKR
jgi:pimeloyl-ACP methyl ester carboxylesterase